MIIKTRMQRRPKNDVDLEEKYVEYISFYIGEGPGTSFHGAYVDDINKSKHYDILMELANTISLMDNMEKILQAGMFPEPLVDQFLSDYKTKKERAIKIYNKYVGRNLPQIAWHTAFNNEHRFFTAVREAIGA